MKDAGSYGGSECHQILVGDSRVGARLTGYKVSRGHVSEEPIFFSIFVYCPFWKTSIFIT